MIIGKYNFNRLGDFEQVCLCAILKNEAKLKKTISPVSLSSNMWEFDLKGNAKLNDNGKEFLTFCKKADTCILPNRVNIDYVDTFDAMIKVMTKCGKKSLVERFLYFSDMDLNDAKEHGLLIMKDDELVLTPTARDLMYLKCILEIRQTLIEKDFKKIIKNNESKITTATNEK